jgi:hypothetical protein
VSVRPAEAAIAAACRIFRDSPALNPDEYELVEALREHLR